MESMKVKIPGENIYYYPDILVTPELQTDENRYVQFEPELLAEVISDFSRKKDLVDKLIYYQKFNSPQYYLILERERQEITVINRTAQGSWQSETYNELESVIKLAHFEIEFKLSEVYSVE
jgi:Uma2 family endonuclease